MPALVAALQQGSCPGQSRCSPCPASTSYSSAAARPQLLPRGGRRQRCSLAPPPAAAGLSQSLAAPTRPACAVVVPQCGGLKKERKKLSKVLKSHRKRLEALLPAVTTSQAVLSDVLLELRSLQARLDAGMDQSHINALLYNDNSSDSDSDNDECRNPAPAVAMRRRPAAVAATSMAPAPTSTSTADSLTVHDARGRTHEVAMPQLDPVESSSPFAPWSPEEFNALQFGGTGRVLVCQGGKCQKRGALEVLQAVSALAAGNPNIEVLPCKCVGKCSEGAALRVRPEGAKCQVYTRVQPEQLPAVFDAHFSAPAPVPEATPACCLECGHHDHEQADELVREAHGIA